MTKFKRIAAAVIAVATMATTSVSAFADDTWKIDYTYGAPSSISNQFVRKTYGGHSGKTITVTCDSLNSGGRVELLTSGFSPSVTAMFSKPGEIPLGSPSSVSITIELWARTNRVIADGLIIW